MGDMGDEIVKGCGMAIIRFIVIAAAIVVIFLIFK